MNRVRTKLHMKTQNIRTEAKIMVRERDTYSWLYGMSHTMEKEHEKSVETRKATHEGKIVYN